MTKRKASFDLTDDNLSTGTMTSETAATAILHPAGDVVDLNRVDLGAENPLSRDMIIEALSISKVSKPKPLAFPSFNFCPLQRQ